MDRSGTSQAEVEYAIMLAILDFQTEIMKVDRPHVQVQVLDGVIEVALSRSAPIPAEERLARSAEGERLLRQVHQAMFDSCEGILRERIEQAVGERVRDMAATIDPLTGRTAISIRLQRAAMPSPSLSAPSPSPR